MNAGSEQQIDEAFNEMSRRQVSAILYSAGLFFQVHRERLVGLAARHAIPAMYEWREFVATGGLVSYSPNRFELYRQLGLYAARILKGEKPADLPNHTADHVRASDQLEDRQSPWSFYPLGNAGRR